MSNVIARCGRYLSDLLLGEIVAKGAGARLRSQDRNPRPESGMCNASQGAVEDCHFRRFLYNLASPEKDRQERRARDERAAAPGLRQ
ncbi:hypothetical protein E4U47_006784 [Claviceps purpurea]|nr:hypothetical protein E4U47_006784 [Claviceps purpurea]